MNDWLLLRVYSLDDNLNTINKKLLREMLSLKCFSFNHFTEKWNKHIHFFLSYAALEIPNIVTLTFHEVNINLVEISLSCWENMSRKQECSASKHAAVRYAKQTYFRLRLERVGKQWPTWAKVEPCLPTLRRLPSYIKHGRVCLSLYPACRALRLMYSPA